MDSIWADTLESLRDRVGGSQPLPAGVSIAAVSGSLAMALLAKVLDINGTRKSFSGDRERVGALIAAARTESANLKRLADADVAAFNHYMLCVRGGGDVAAAMREAIEVPMNTARSGARGLDLCAEAVGLVQGLTAADLGIAAALLQGAVRAALVSIDFNLSEMRSDPAFSSGIAVERLELERRARKCADVINPQPSHPAKTI
jgi:methenyltetrahydrofolate cyclohydrolase